MAPQDRVRLRFISFRNSKQFDFKRMTSETDEALINVCDFIQISKESSFEYFQIKILRSIYI